MQHGKAKAISGEVCYAIPQEASVDQTSQQDALPTSISIVSSLALTTIASRCLRRYYMRRVAHVIASMRLLVISRESDKGERQHALPPSAVSLAEACQTP